MNEVKIITFTTCQDELSSHFILDQYLSLFDAPVKMEKINETISVFKRVLNDEVIIVKFYSVNLNDEVKDSFLAPSYLCQNGDSFIIFISLNDKHINSLKNLKIITKLVKTECDPDKKINIIGIANDNENCKLNGENANNYLDEQRIFFEYYEVNLNDLNSLKKILDSIFLQALRDKIMDNNNENIPGENVSNSRCAIY